MFAYAVRPYGDGVGAPPEPLSDGRWQLDTTGAGNGC